MKDVCLRRLVGSYTSNERGVFGVGWTSVDKRWTNNGHWEIPSVDNEETDEFFNSVDYKITSQFLRLFLSSDKLGWAVVF